MNMRFGMSMIAGIRQAQPGRSVQLPAVLHPNRHRDAVRPGPYRLVRRVFPRHTRHPPTPSLAFSRSPSCACSPYMWPYCTQPLYHTAIPVIVNCTVLNALDVVGTFVEPPEWRPNPGSAGSAFLEVGFSYSRILWPWTGYLAVHLTVSASGVDFSGTAEVGSHAIPDRPLARILCPCPHPVFARSFTSGHDRGAHQQRRKDRHRRGALEGGHRAGPAAHPAAAVGPVPQPALSAGLLSPRQPAGTHLPCTRSLLQDTV